MDQKLLEISLITVTRDGILVEPDDVEKITMTPEVDGFNNFGLSDAVLKGIAEAGFTNPSPIQKDAIPVVMDRRDVIGQAHTGTGKTAAFALPGLSRIRRTGKVEILVITPTRELANQVSDEIYRLGKFVPVRTVAIYGGQPYGRQLESLRRAPEVVVATPGRLLDLLEGGRLRGIMSPWLVVLDEADEMLDMGFLEDVEKIFSLLQSPEGETDGTVAIQGGEESARRQTLLFSATMPGPIRELASRFLVDPVTIRALDPQGKKGGANQDIQQQYYVIDEHERDDATVRLIDSMEPSRAIIFCRTKREVDRVAGSLAARGIPAQPLHGDMEQPMRERAIAAFRGGEFQVLVATDVAARGLDIPDVSHVFNYHLPFDPESYVHRIGRTGRAGRKGVAVTLVTPHEYHQLRRMQPKVGQMENRIIPTHQDLRKAGEEKLLDELRRQELSEESTRFLRMIEEELGLAEAAHKMLSLLLARDGVSGPDRIGVRGARLERLHEPKPRKGPPKYGNKPGAPRFGKPGFGKPGYEKREFGKTDGRKPRAVQGENADFGKGKGKGPRPWGDKKAVGGPKRSGAPAFRGKPKGGGFSSPARKKRAS